MSVSGLYQICEAAPAQDQCSRCGTLVCGGHYDEETGLCTDCTGTVDRGDAHTA